MTMITFHRSSSDSFVYGDDVLWQAADHGDTDGEQQQQQQQQQQQLVPPSVAAALLPVDDSNDNDGGKENDLLSFLSSYLGGHPLTTSTTTNHNNNDMTTCGIQTMLRLDHPTTAAATTAAATAVVGILSDLSVSLDSHNSASSDGSFSTHSSASSTTLLPAPTSLTVHNNNNNNNNNNNHHHHHPNNTNATHSLSAADVFRKFSVTQDRHAVWLAMTVRVPTNHHHDPDDSSRHHGHYYSAIPNRQRIQVQLHTHTTTRTKVLQIAVLGTDHHPAVAVDRNVSDPQFDTDNITATLAAASGLLTVRVAKHSPSSSRRPYDRHSQLPAPTQLYHAKPSPVRSELTEVCDPITVHVPVVESDEVPPEAETNIDDTGNYENSNNHKKDKRLVLELSPSVRDLRVSYHHDHVWISAAQDPTRQSSGRRRRRTKRLHTKFPVHRHTVDVTNLRATWTTTSTTGWLVVTAPAILLPPTEDDHQQSQEENDRRSPQDDDKQQETLQEAYQRFPQEDTSPGSSRHYFPEDIPSDEEEEDSSAFHHHTLDDPNDGFPEDELVPSTTAVSTTASPTSRPCSTPVKSTPETIAMTPTSLGADQRTNRIMSNTRSSPSSWSGNSYGSGPHPQWETPTKKCDDDSVASPMEAAWTCTSIVVQDAAAVAAHHPRFRRRVHSRARRPRHWHRLEDDDTVESFSMEALQLEFALMEEEIRQTNQAAVDAAYNCISNEQLSESTSILRGMVGRRGRRV